MLHYWHLEHFQGLDNQRLEKKNKSIRKCFLDVFELKSSSVFTQKSLINRFILAVDQMTTCNVKEVAHNAKPTELSSPARSLPQLYLYCASQLTALVLWLQLFVLIHFNWSHSVVPTCFQLFSVALRNPLCLIS